jgi:hypothetical protein
MSLQILILLAVLFAEFGDAQSRSISPLEQRALTAPNGLAAHFLIRVADREPKVSTKRELLKQAFSLADQAKRSFPLSCGSDLGCYTESSAALEYELSLIRVDELSLKSDIVSKMGEVDPRQALELANRMVPLSLPACDCSQVNFPYAHPFYDSVRRLNDNLPPNLASGGDLFIERMIGDLKSLQQLSPLVSLVLNAPRSADKKRLWLSRISSGLESVRIDPRVLGAFEDENLLNYGREAFEKFGDTTLIAAYEKLLRRAQDQVQCADAKHYAFPPGTRGPERRDLLILRFNQFVEHLPAGWLPKLSLIEPTNRNTPPRKPGPIVMRLNQVSPNPELYELALDLRFGSPEREAKLGKKKRPSGRREWLPLEERTTVEWRLKAEDYLKKLQSFPRNGEWERQGYRLFVLAAAYPSFLELIPAGPLFAQTADSFISLLTSAEERDRDPALWLWAARSLIEPEVEFDREQKALLRQRLMESPDPLLRLALDLAPVAK